MGYESRIYVINKMDIPAGLDGKFKYADRMAIYEMCKFPPFQELFGGNCPVTEYAPYDPGDGDHPVTEDKYGDPLMERSITEVIDCLDQYISLKNKNSKIYARVKPLRAMLQEFEKIQDNYYRLAVLHYGY